MGYGLVQRNLERTCIAFHAIRTCLGHAREQRFRYSRRTEY